MNLLAGIYWDPDRYFFIVPYINHPVTWYGFLFALGFLAGYLIIRTIFTHFLESTTTTHMQAKLEAAFLTDRLALFVVFGTIIGARLGHVFFYDWSYYKEHPLDILKIWEGGACKSWRSFGDFCGSYPFFNFF